MLKKAESPKEYINWENNCKKRVLLYLNYVVTVVGTCEGAKSYQDKGELFCWEHTIYILFIPYGIIGSKLCLKYFSINVSALINAIIHHSITYMALIQKNNYLATIVSFIGHYQMRSLFITHRLMAATDIGLISFFLGLTFHRMANQLFDDQGNCLWDYNNMKADIFDTISRIIMFNASLYLADYFTHKKLKCLRNLAEKIEDQSKEKEIFFACISHELRNPLNSLLASLEILPSTHKSKVPKLLTVAKSCGDSLLHLIGNILDVSKIKEQKLELNIRETDISEIISKVIMMHSLKAKNKRLSLEIYGDSNIPPCVKIDGERITQILTNLISNSIKFTNIGQVIINLTWIPILIQNYSNRDFELAIEEAGESSNREELLSMVDEYSNTSLGITRKGLGTKLMAYGSISKIKEESDLLLQCIHGPWIQYPKGPLSSRRNIPNKVRSKDNKEKGVLKVEIIDSGIGISPENIHKLFQPFTQADGAISQRFGGTGLGLWIAKNMVEMMGGCIQIESELDHGTNFMVILPLISGAEENSVDEENMNVELLQNLYKGRRILYVEDISENQMVMSELLRQLGFKVHLAIHGAEGLDIFRRSKIGHFDVILTDLRMPNMSGQSMIMKIREFEDCMEVSLNERTPIIVLTGDPSENEKNKCLNILQATAFLVKPVPIFRLNRTLRNIFNKEENKLEVMKKNNKKIILLIENNKLLSNLIRNSLEDYEFIQAFTIAEGKQRFMDNDGKLFAICLDGHFKDGIGLTFLEYARQYEREVKKMPDHKLVKVIITATASLQKQRKLYKNLFVSHYLMKPYTNQELLATLQLLQ